MTTIGSSTCVLALAAALGASPAYGQPAPGPVPVPVPVPVPGEIIYVIGPGSDSGSGSDGARDRQRALGETPFVSIIHPDDHPATASVADAVATTVGAQARSLGGLGAFESVSIRGQAPGQTTVFVDGIPLSRLAAVTTDLGRYALDAFGEVDLYRGAVPVELGGAGVGGALDLITRLGPGEHGERLRASLGTGSYGARHLRVHYGDTHAGGRLRSATTLGYQAASGDFSYFDNAGTPLNPSDDTTAVRRNNAFAQVDGATRVGRADGRAVGGVRVAYKHQGLPGSIANPSLAAELATLDVIADARGDVDVGAATTRTRGYAVIEDQTLRDPLGELGLGAQTRRGVTLSAGGASTWSVPLGQDRLVGGLELRGERYRDSDLSGALPTARPGVTGARAGGALLAAYDLALAAGLVVTPAVRLDVERTSPGAASVGPMAGEPLAARWDLVPSPRLGARAALGADLALKGSAGWYERRPTLIELFGDRGFVLGAPDLLPERGLASDAGLVWAPAHELGGVDRILVEADAFATHSRNTIAFVTYAGFVSRAENIGRTQTYGGELVGSARVLRLVTVTASYTRLASEQLSDEVSYAGKPIPRDPGHLAYARADLVHAIAGHTAALWLDAALQSATTIDPAGMGIVPGRGLVGAGARVGLGGGVALALDVANLGDVRVVQAPAEPRAALSDVAGFPLPGRTFYLSLDWTH